MVYDMATASSRAESSHNHRGTSQLYAIGESKTQQALTCGRGGVASGSRPCHSFRELTPTHHVHLRITVFNLNKSANCTVKVSLLPSCSASFLCQNQEEEKPVWDYHLCGGDSGGGVAPYSKVSQLLQS